MPSSFTPARNYVLQATGEDVNTWGINLNSNFSIIDNNLGGTLALNVGGNSNITLSSAQAQNLIHNLSGALTGNINYIFPDAGGFFAVTNNTTGAYTLTVTVAGGSGGIIVPQGTTATIYIDATIPQVESFVGTQYTFVGSTVSGTNTLTISQTFPGNFSLLPGVLITITPPNVNTGSVTLNVNGTGAKTIQKISANGLTNLTAGDIGGFPLILQYNGTVFIALNIVLVGYETTVSTNQAVGYGNLFTPYVATAACTFTIDQSTTLTSYWYVDIFAQGGAVTIAINASDKINNGATGVGMIMPIGSSGRLITDANGNLWLNFKVLPALGQCYFQYTSTTLCKLSPYNGNNVTFPNGQVCAIGTSGIATTVSSAYLNGTAAQSLSPTTLYYAYLWNNAGNYVVDWSTTGHATDATTGIEIKSGDRSRVLVGMAYPQTGPAFLASTATQFVGSWFNRKRKSLVANFTTVRTVTSTTYTEVNAEIQNSFLTWGEAIRVSAAGSYSNSNSNIATYSAIGVDGVSTLYSAVIAQNSGAGFNNNLAGNIAISPSEGAHYVTIAGKVQSNTGTWIGGSISGDGVVTLTTDMWL